MSKGKKIALWTVSILLAALFLFAGAPKLLQPAKIGPMFVQYGYAAWFATVIGICEVLGAIGLLVPRVAGLAASGLSIIMVGAVYTLVSHHEGKQAIFPLVTLALLVMVSYTRFQEAKA
jgi:putative oxidoreductase